MSDAMTPGLEALIGDTSVETFVREHWQKKPFVNKGDSARLEPIRKTLLGLDLQKILESVPDMSQVNVQAPVDHEVFPSKDVPTLLTLYDCGCQIHAPCAQIDGMMPWLEGVSRDLPRLPKAGGKLAIFAARKGSGITPHFDRGDNFAVQLSGSKKWVYGVEPGLPEPLHKSQEDIGYPPAGNERSIAAGEEREIIVEEGDILYMPRGFWHRTESLEDSFSLHIDVHPYPWLEVLFEALKRTFSQSIDWRRSANDAPGAFDARIEQLQMILSAMRSDDLTKPPGRREGKLGNLSDTTILRRNPLAWWKGRAEEGGKIRVFVHYPPDHMTGYVLPESFMEGLRWLAPSRPPFSLEDWRLATSMSEANAVALARVLIKAGMLDYAER